MKVSLPEDFRPFLEGRLPPDCEPVWFSAGITDYEQTAQAAADAEVAWIALYPPPRVAPVVERAKKVRWIATSLAGVNGWPLREMAERGIILTNGAGLGANIVSDFAVMGVLVLAKNFRELVYAQDRKEFVARAPGTGELDGSRALVIGYGQIGRAIGERLKAFGVEVTGVRRNPGGEAGVIGPGDWKGRLGEFDWIVLAAASTRETARMIGREELAAMKPTAGLVNIARGDLIDQAALIEAMHAGALGGAFLDVTDPEPAPQSDPIWTTPGVILTSHTAGRSHSGRGTTERAAALFLDNLQRWQAGQPLLNQVDLELGY
jgi:phosphoglycerate dehydrogenase-like enzyme